MSVLHLRSRYRDMVMGLGTDELNFTMCGKQFWMHDDTKDMAGIRNLAWSALCVRFSHGNVYQWRPGMSHEKGFGVLLFGRKAHSFALTIHK